jgi:hypothetical protein
VELGEKNNSYFLGLEKKRQAKKSINKLKDENGDIICNNLISIVFFVFKYLSIRLLIICLYSSSFKIELFIFQYPLPFSVNPGLNFKNTL